LIKVLSGLFARRKEDRFRCRPEIVPSLTESTEQRAGILWEYSSRVADLQQDVAQTDRVTEVNPELRESSSNPDGAIALPNISVNVSCMAVRIAAQVGVYLAHNSMWVVPKEARPT
jgi:hypothetical protein